MSIYFKTGGAWTQVQRPYVKRNGVWTPVKQTYRKVAGAWTLVDEWDITPPPPPSIELNLVPTANGRYIDVAINIPGAHNPDVKMIRVLTSKSSYPATQFGGTYWSTPDVTYPDEPWSDFYYGSGFDHSNTGTQYHKQFPVNPNADSNLAAGSYYFSAWTLDHNGNWSAVDNIQQTVPKAGVGNNAVIRSARFQASNSGSYVDGTGFVTGDLRQAINPAPSRGMYFYSGGFTTEIGSAYGDASVTINNAQIYLRRIDTDGSATANVYIFRHAYTAPGGIGVSLNTGETTKLGTLAKGEGKWFPIPESYYSDIIAGVTKGFGFAYKDPMKASGFAEDYTVIAGLSEDNRRQGEFYVAWQELPS
jgi:hypothetical protein